VLKKNSLTCERDLTIFLLWNI